MQRILLYRPLHECLTTRYRAKYSCSSTDCGCDEVEGVAADDDDSDGGGGGGG